MEYYLMEFSSTSFLMILKNLDFFLPQTVQFNTSTILFCLVFLTLEFLFWHNTFPLISYSVLYSYTAFRILLYFVFHLIIFYYHIICRKKFVMILFTGRLRLYKLKLQLYLIWFFLTTLFHHAFSSCSW